MTQARLDQLAERILAALAKPVRIGSAEAVVSASNDILVITEDYPCNSRQIIHDTEARIRHVKSYEGNMAHYFTLSISLPNMH